MSSCNQMCWVGFGSCPHPSCPHRVDGHGELWGSRWASAAQALVTTPGAAGGAAFPQMRGAGPELASQGRDKRVPRPTRVVSEPRRWAHVSKAWSVTCMVEPAGVFTPRVHRAAPHLPPTCSEKLGVALGLSSCLACPAAGHLVDEGDAF